MSETILKGGSLATTSVITEDGQTFVRKKISLDKEREYGYYRWYSQLKKLQRFDKMFPGKFVKVLDFGLLGEFAFMDLEYHEDAVNCYEYLCEDRTDREVEILAWKILSEVRDLHNFSIDSSQYAMELYFEEEIMSKIRECYRHSGSFRSIYNNSKIPAMLPTLKEVAVRLHLPTESFTHGNLTLENILFLRNSQEVLFIDPYEENIIDNKYNDYSQLLQSANSHYELICQYGDDYEVPSAISLFNQTIDDFMRNALNGRERRLTWFFECSQYYRMLPFKLKASGGDIAALMPFLQTAERLTKELIDAI